MRIAPSRRITSPLRYSFSTIESAIAATSSGRPSRDGFGTIRPSESSTSCGSSPSSGVSKIPGAIVATLTRLSARSRAAGRVSPTMPPFEAEYDAWPTWPSKAATETGGTAADQGDRSIEVQAFAPFSYS
ncbi:MAG: putative secreted protein [Actinomycetota bacterium]|jgi:hypothetical protein|nr:putative secreted protein [Actinomycetota bacterium]